jgi:hypothetical protein
MQFLQICIKMPNDCFHIKVLTLSEKALTWLELGEIFDTELKNQN